ncbi:MAG: hypothetical protein ACRC1E_10000, partial [Craterilacuibacter sp.]
MTARHEAISGLADQAFARAAGAPLIGGNHARLLYDSSENFPAWEAAIAAARHSILIEMYIFANDSVGQALCALLAERARAGVRVLLLVDWFGCWREIL